MTEEFDTFIRRLKKIGIELEFNGNYPWVYLDKVNGKKVQGRFMGNGFTVFWYPFRVGDKMRITDIKTVFSKIRETLEK